MPEIVYTETQLNANMPSIQLVPAPLKLRPYGAIQICLLLSLLLLLL